MVGTTRQSTFASRDGYNSRQQAEFIRQLRLLYQRNLRTRTSVRVTETPSTQMPVATHLTQTLPLGWGPTAAHTAAVGTVTADGSDGDAEDPCPAGQQQAAAGTAAAAPAAAATVHTEQQQQQQQEEVEDDSDDGPPSGVDTSEDEESDDNEQDEEDTPELSDDLSEDADFVADEGRARNNNDYDRATTAATASQVVSNGWRRASRHTAGRAIAGLQHQQQLQQQQQQLGLGTAVPLLPPEAWRRPAACSFLQRGMAFEGCQQLMQHTAQMERWERWTVSVTLHDVDLDTGCISGTMHARDIPDVSHAIETFWEGCIIDGVNHTFYTRAWGASNETDLQHWAKFDSFGAIRAEVEQHSGRCGQLEQHPVIYMRWKEQFFVQAQQRDCGLTIAGFYYVALHRQTGQLQGFYYDPHSSPYQELNLDVRRGSSGGSSSSSSAASRRRGTGPAARGVSFPSYSFA